MKGLLVIKLKKHGRKSDKRPDYDEWLKEQEKIVEKQSKDGIDEKTAGVGLGILLFLLL